MNAVAERRYIQFSFPDGLRDPRDLKAAAAIKDPEEREKIDKVPKKLLVLPNIINAKDSTGIFLELIHSLMNHPSGNKLKGKKVLLIGVNHGAITTQLLRSGVKELEILDVDSQAIKNMYLNLEEESQAVKDKLVLARLSNLDSALSEDPDPEMSGKRFDYVFFNHPIKRETGDTNNSAGDTFELPIEYYRGVLPRRLEPGGTAYGLSVEPFDTNNYDPFSIDDNQENLWDIHNALDAIESNPSQKDWVLERTIYRSQYAPQETPGWDYNIVKVRRPAINENLNMTPNSLRETKIKSLHEQVK